MRWVWILLAVAVGVAYRAWTSGSDVSRKTSEAGTQTPNPPASQCETAACAQEAPSEEAAAPQETPLDSTPLDSTPCEQTSEQTSEDAQETPTPEDVRHIKGARVRARVLTFLRGARDLHDAR